MSDPPPDVPTPDISVDDLIARGVYDPEAADAASTLVSIRTALRLGAHLDDIVEHRDDFGALIARLQLRPGRERYTIEEAAARAGSPVERVTLLNRISGFAEPKPDAKAFDDRDVEVFQLFDAGCDVFGEDLMFQLTRVMGSAMGRVADAMVSAFASVLGERSQAEPITEEFLADHNRFAVGLLPSAMTVMDVLLRRHMQARSRSTLPMADEWLGVDALDRGIGFCDLVGYTTLTEELSAREVVTVVAEFEDRASDVITDLGGSVVKFIGDEVMFVSEDAGSAVTIGLALVDAFERSDLASVRVGLAAGRVLLREGDYYGPVVNLAARIVKLAPPGSVLVPAALRDSVGDSVVYEDAGSPTLKGFGTPVGLAVVHRS